MFRSPYLSSRRKLHITHKLAFTEINIMDQRPIIFINVFLISLCHASARLNHNSQILEFHDCTERETTLTCDHDVPDQIPPGVTDVYVRDLNTTWVKDTFSHKSWKFITKLDIKLNSIFHWDKAVLVSKFFTNLCKLTNLKSFGIHGRNTKTLGTLSKVFLCLTKVENLDLANCPSLTGVVVAQALARKESLPSLRSLNLKGIQAELGRFLVLNQTFMDMIRTKAIQKLTLSGTNIYVEDRSVFDSDYSIEDLDVSNITVFLKSNSHLSRPWQERQHILDKVKTLNISNISNRFINLEYDLNINITTDCNGLKMLKILENVFANNINEQVLTMPHTFINISQCQTLGNFKILHFRGNNLRSINVTVHYPMNMKLREIDISSNGMVYLSPNTFQELHGIQILIMSNNSLSEMEHFQEFGNLLQTFSMLQHMDMAHNKLTFIPYYMFFKNTKLKILDLKGNNLQSITFKVKHLDMLEVLDLTMNKIMYLEGTYFAELQSLYDERREGIKYGTKLLIKFEGNPLRCLCRGLIFIKWLKRHLQPSMNYTYQCDLENKRVEIDDNAEEKTTYLCNRARIITAFAVSSFVTIVTIIVITAVILCKIRKRKQDDVTRKFLMDFKKGKLEEKYLAFLSYSSDDGDLAMLNIFPQLDNTLKHMVGQKLDRDIVCLGDIHFRPGISLINEIMRCVSESCVVIFVISRAFCASSWCRMELKEAYQQEKPIILIFREQVEQTLMPQYLRFIFQRYARAKLVRVNDHYEIIPGWKKMCESVIYLACRKEGTTKALYRERKATD